jgi:hypothetical protein
MGMGERGWAEGVAEGKVKTAVMAWSARAPVNPAPHR